MEENKNIENVEEQDQFYDFFTDKNVLLWAVIISCVVLAVRIVTNFIYFGFDEIFSIVIYAVMFACLVELAISYHRHEKNIMKPLIGVVLMGTFVDKLTMTLAPFQNEALKVYVDEAGTAGLVFKVILIVDITLYAVFFLMHFIINASHRSNQKKVAFNQILVILLLFVELISFVVNIFILNVMGAQFGVLSLTTNLASICIVCVIICIESLLDSFRIKREAAGWTEKK